MTHAVRTTMRPDEVIEVGDAEHLDLHRQGLLLPEDSQSPAAPAPTPKKTASPAATNKEG